MCTRSTTKLAVKETLVPLWLRLLASPSRHPSVRESRVNWSLISDFLIKDQNSHHIHAEMENSLRH